MSKPNLLSAYTEKSTCIKVANEDYAEIGEWSDGNPSNEDRLGYFVSICLEGPTHSSIIKADSLSHVRGVTVTAPGFSANAEESMFNESKELLSKYSYVALSGFASVIDNGNCRTIGGKCVPADDGTAIPSNSEFGYPIIRRIDDTHILILVEPQGDSIKKLHDKIHTSSNMLIGTLQAGVDGIAFVDSSIKSDSIIDIYFEDKLLSPTRVKVSDGSVIIEILPQDTDTRIGITIS